MKIQGRLTLGIGVLFAMILLLGIQSVSYVRQLSRATGTILADNYNSLQYAGDMLRSLNDIGQDSVSRHALRQSRVRRRQPRRNHDAKPGFAQPARQAVGHLHIVFHHQHLAGILTHRLFHLLSS